MLAALLNERSGVLLLEGNPRPGAKISVSGGGRCNLSNLSVESSRYRAEASFVSSVLSRYPESWVRGWFSRRGVRTRPEKEGRLFCVDGAEAVNRALREARSGVELLTRWRVDSVEHDGRFFRVRDARGKELFCRRLVVASGGLSFPKLGASDIGLRIAEGFGHRIVRTSPALVGWTLQPPQAFFRELSGVSTEAVVQVGGRSWRDRVLFAHRGISGPAILNASLWWDRGEVSIDFLPGFDLRTIRGGRKQLSTLLPLPRRLARALLEHLEIADRPASSLDGGTWKRLERLRDYRFAPAGTFGYGKAEVTRGGVATEEIDPETMESRLVPGLYFVGEVLDVTGELGGYNFQWAFSSAAVCAEALNRREER
jgi:predicted Rossmann fold flavoprotein